jgi:glycosyltransferase involved in cell wall biosynthesis
MRLAVEVTTCTSLRAGIGYYTEHLVDALLKSRAPGDEVVLISNRPPADDLATRWADHLKIGGRAVRAIWLQTDAPRMLAENGIDVAAFPNYIVPLSSPCPTISFVHDLAVLRTPELFTWRKRVVTRSLLGRSVVSAAAVATVSEASRRDILDLLGVPPERVVLLPGAAHPSCGAVSGDAVAAVRAKYQLHRPYILTVGTIEPRKNLLTLLAAFDEVLAGGGEQIDLVVVGGRGWRDRRLIDELKARTHLGHVHWLGYVPEQELVALYGGTRMLVYPSRLEGFGLPVLEAMTCGAPVVASDVAALREVAADAACFVPPGDVSALATAISRLLVEPGEIARMRTLGFLRAQNFSWAHTAERLWKLAREIGPAREQSSRKRPTATRGAERVAERVEVPPMPSPIGPAPDGLLPRQWSLLAAVTYADLFDAPLPLDEATTLCIGATADMGETKRAVSDAALSRHVTLHESGHLVLSGRDELIGLRQQGVVVTNVLLDRHRRVLGWLASLPFVRMLAFSGGTAHQNPGRQPGKKPDIDLFVITAPGRLYTAYTLIFLFTKLTRTRAVVCPNYLIDENELLIAYHHDLFTAHQLVSARAISGAETYLAFCRANEGWVRAFYPGFQPRPVVATLGRPWLQRAGEIVLSLALAPVERLVRHAWRFYLGRRAAKARHPDVVLADGILKLHLSDFRRRVLERFAARLDAVRATLAEERALSGPLERRAGRS